jgi:uncharacterized membrane protein
MSGTGILLVAAVVLGIAWVVLHAVMVVQGFKTSIGWGLVALLVPLGSLAFAFAKSGRKALAAAFLVSFLGWVVCGGIVSYLTAQAALEAVDAGRKGMDEFDKQTQDLDNLDNIDLKL